MSDTFTVYMHTNKINGKRYIGITMNAVEKRWGAGSGYHKNKYLTRAIKKYGWDNFDHNVLAVGLTKEEACKTEQDMIAFFNTQDKRYGYNQTSGGEHFKHSEESKLLMSKNRTGIKPPPFTEEHKRRIREHHGGGADAKGVICVDTGETFASINDAARKYNINKKQISNCCRNVLHYNTAGGYHWKFLQGEKDVVI